MSKKYLQDSKIDHVPEDATIASAAISLMLSSIVSTEPDLAEMPVQSNVPQLDEHGQPNYTIGQNDDGSISFDIVNADAFAQPYAVTIWDDDKTIAQATGESLKAVKMLYIINLPTAEQLRTDPKLKAWRVDVLERASLMSARKIATAITKGVEGFGLMDDPVSQFLAAQTSAATRERAFNALYPVMVAALIRQGAKLAERLTAAGNKGDAAMVKSTWSRARLSKDTLKAVLSSHAMADFYFPAMTKSADKLQEGELPGMAFDNFIRKFVAYAPNHKRKVTLKDAAGDALKEIVDGKERNQTAMVPSIQDASILVHWLNTRYDVDADVAETEADISLDFSDLQMG